MPRDDKTGKRPYDSAGRKTAAAQRRLDVVAAAHDAFAERGWAGTRVADIAALADVSQKTVEASFGTKAALLRAAVDYAIRGDLDPLPMPQRGAVLEMERAPDAAAMLRLHARHLRLVNVRSSRIALVVEQAAPTDRDAAALWRRMNRNRDYAVDWATKTLLRKRGRRRGLTPERVRPVFWVALDWSTYRTLTDNAGLDPDGYEEWLRAYYDAMILRRP
jgi:AcrR family transcriptional regulator